MGLDVLFIIIGVVAGIVVGIAKVISIKSQEKFLDVIKKFIKKKGASSDNPLVIEVKFDPVFLLLLNSVQDRLTELEAWKEDIFKK